jgi:hypothetical protein
MNRFQILTVAALTAVVCLPAHAQRPCFVTFAVPNTKAAATTRIAVAANVGASFAKAPLTMVSGGGQALLADPDGDKFSHQFSISAVVNNDGSARGKAKFVFPMLFSQKWGALPGVDMMHLDGEITEGSVHPDGKVELTGPFIETDYTRGDGIVFEEDSRVSGSSPLKIVVAPQQKEFTLSWCDFIPPGGTGSFSVEVTSGNLKVH